jgi:hypothetical protein
VAAVVSIAVAAVVLAVLFTIQHLILELLVQVLRSRLVLAVLAQRAAETNKDHQVSILCAAVTRQQPVAAVVDFPIHHKRTV